MKKNIILEKIYYSFNNEAPIINNLSFEFPSGQTIAILGHSGCGKSTLLQMISGILKPISGNITIDNNKDLLGNISYMQQNDLLFPWLTVKENVLLPLKILGDKSQSSYDDVIEKSKILGINEYIDFYPNELSGGLKQRAAFLRTIIQRSEFILFNFSYIKFALLLKVSFINFTHSWGPLRASKAANWALALTHECIFTASFSAFSNR